MQFEGNGLQSVWKLEFRTAANPSGLDDLADVLITMNLRAQFSATLYQKRIQQSPSNITKFVLVSSAQIAKPGLNNLQKNNDATIAFDLTTINLPRQEKGRKINNVVIIFAGGPTTLKASFSIQSPTRTIHVSVSDGTIFSNNPPITDSQSTSLPSPLNVLAGISVDQIMSLIVRKADNGAADFSTVRDVLLGIDYSAVL